MNTLSYGLLGLLARRESSGYDLMLRIQPFWQAKHSQIYPLLSSMEEKQLLSSHWVQQSDKPDKKIYAITEKACRSCVNGCTNRSRLQSPRMNFLFEPFVCG